MKEMKRIICFSFFIFHLSFSAALIYHFSFSVAPCYAQSLTLVELNCENFFDCRHDSLKQDGEWLPDGARHWTPARYWRKQNHIGQELLSCQEEGIPDLVALVEVENDSVLHSLTRRSLLRNAGYEYLMTSSPDVRGIDVALLYQPLAFRPLCYDCLTVQPLPGMRPTRDILYVQGEIQNRDTLHVFVVHAPSRFGGERVTRPNRQQVAQRLVNAIRQLPSDARIVVCGDFNDEAGDPALDYLVRQGLHHVSRSATGLHRQASATYRYQGRWSSIDHVFASPSLAAAVEQVYVNDAPFLLEEDQRYGGCKPRRTFNGYRYQPGFSDHLPLVVRFKINNNNF